MDKAERSMFSFACLLALFLSIEASGLKVCENTSNMQNCDVCEGDSLLKLAQDKGGLDKQSSMSSMKGNPNDESNPKSNMFDFVNEYARVRGDLTVVHQSTGMRSISFPNLDAVDGSILIWLEASLQILSLPMLRYVGGQIQIIMDPGVVVSHIQIGGTVPLRVNNFILLTMNYQAMQDVPVLSRLSIPALAKVHGANFTTAVRCGHSICITNVQVAEVNIGENTKTGLDLYHGIWIYNKMGLMKNIHVQNVAVLGPVKLEGHMGQEIRNVTINALKTNCMGQTSAINVTSVEFLFDMTFMPPPLLTITGVLGLDFVDIKNGLVQFNDFEPISYDNCSGLGVWVASQERCVNFPAPQPVDSHLPRWPRSGLLRPPTRWKDCSSEFTVWSIEDLQDFEYYCLENGKFYGRLVVLGNPSERVNTEGFVFRNLTEAAEIFIDGADGFIINVEFPNLKKVTKSIVVTVSAPSGELDFFNMPVLEETPDLVIGGPMLKGFIGEIVIGEESSKLNISRIRIGNNYECGACINTIDITRLDSRSRVLFSGCFHSNLVSINNMGESVPIDEVRFETGFMGTIKNVMINKVSELNHVYVFGGTCGAANLNVMGVGHPWFSVQNYNNSNYSENFNLVFDYCASFPVPSHLVPRLTLNEYVLSKSNLAMLNIDKCNYAGILGADNRCHCFEEEFRSSSRLCAPTCPLGQVGLCLDGHGEILPILSSCSRRFAGCFNMSSTTSTSISTMTSKTETSVTSVASPSVTTQNVGTTVNAYSTVSPSVSPSSAAYATTVTTTTSTVPIVKTSTRTLTTSTISLTSSSNTQTSSTTSMSPSQVNVREGKQDSSRLSAHEATYIIVGIGILTLVIIVILGVATVRYISNDWHDEVNFARPMGPNMDPNSQTVYNSQFSLNPIESSQRLPPSHSQSPSGAEFEDRSSDTDVFSLSPNDIAETLSELSPSSPESAVDAGSMEDTSLVFLQPRDGECFPQQTIPAWQDPSNAPVGSVPELIVAVKMGDVRAVDELLKNGAPVNAPDSYGRSALHYCVIGFNPVNMEAGMRLLNALLAYKGDPNRPDNDQATPLMYACRDGNEPVVQRLMKEGGSPACADLTGMTPYMLCATYDRVNALTTLLDLDGTVVNAKDRNGRTALHWAVAVGSMDCLSVLLVAEGIDITVADNEGETFLHYAAKSGNEKVLEILSHNVPRQRIQRLVAIKSSDETKAEDVAAANGHENYGSLLKEWMAKATLAPTHVNLPTVQKPSRHHRIKREALVEECGSSSGADSGIDDIKPGAPSFRKRKTILEDLPGPPIKGSRKDYMRHRRMQQSELQQTMEKNVEHLQATHVELSSTLASLKKEAEYLRKVVRLESQETVDSKNFIREAVPQMTSMGSTNV
eukprot:m.23150 g.23150  ORF g.23150 m.23150 type:complete len:1382 (+) comp7469_c0_seq1:205-4350(+)